MKKKKKIIYLKNPYSIKSLKVGLEIMQFVNALFISSIAFMHYKFMIEFIDNLF